MMELESTGASEGQRPKLVQGLSQHSRLADLVKDLQNVG